MDPEFPSGRYDETKSLTAIAAAAEAQSTSVPIHEREHATKPCALSFFLQNFRNLRGMLCCLMTRECGLERQAAVNTQGRLGSSEHTLAATASRPLGRSH